MTLTSDVNATIDVIGGMVNTIGIDTTVINGAAYITDVAPTFEQAASLGPRPGKHKYPHMLINTSHQ